MAKIISAILLVVSILGFGWWAFHSIGQLQSANKDLRSQLDISLNNATTINNKLGVCNTNNAKLQKDLDDLRVEKVKDFVKNGKSLKGLNL